MDSLVRSWIAHIETTLDIDYLTIKVSSEKSAQLVSGLNKGGFYYLTLQAGFEVEIIKVIAAINGILTVERGQYHTTSGVWAAGTPLQARISAKTFEDLRLDLNTIILSNSEVLMAPNGDIITKPIYLLSNSITNQ